MVKTYGIYAALREDHEQIRRLLDRILEPSDGERRDELFAELKRELTSHARAEEIVFYEPLLRRPTTHRAVLRGYEEHHVADILMDELTTGDLADEHWRAKADVLLEILEHHIEQEERYIFEQAKRTMDRDWSAEAAQRFLSEKALLEERERQPR